MKIGDAVALRRIMLGVVLALALGGCVIAWHGTLKPLPEGVSVRGPVRFSEDVRFLADLTFVDSEGIRRVEQSIFDEVFSIIREARKQIVLDLFLFNDFQGVQREEMRALSGELTDTLIAQQHLYPGIEIVLVTDPINTVYGAVPATHLRRLRAEGIDVVVTNLLPLRDSNALYSSLWRWFIRPLGEGGAGWFPNPFGGERVSLRTGLRVLNFKANHRKVILADSAGGWTAVVTSANPHDASSAHGNIAIRFSGRAVADLLETERAVALFSGGRVPAPLSAPLKSKGSVSLCVLTEGKIGEAIDEELAATQRGDEVAVAVFYLSDRAVVAGLIAAHARGVSVRVLLDPNKDAFGREKNGIPNRPVASELNNAGIPVRWCDTHGEQCHAKMLVTRRAERSVLIAGSANFTRRNLRDFNLETNVWLSGTLEDPVIREAWRYFERTWANEPGRKYSVPYEAYSDESWINWSVYRASEFTGIGAY